MPDLESRAVECQETHQPHGGCLLPRVILASSAPMDAPPPLSTPTKRAQPPKVPQDLPTRRAVTFAFWAVALLGVPYWWTTTDIERRPLPTAQLAAWLKKAVACLPSPPEPTRADPRARATAVLPASIRLALDPVPSRKIRPE